jgi:hypothetical protein
MWRKELCTEQRGLHSSHPKPDTVSHTDTCWWTRSQYCSATCKKGPQEDSQGGC